VMAHDASFSLKLQLQLQQYNLPGTGGDKFHSVPAIAIGQSA
jgi:hypothetical protein